jgi:hypothetical protein
MSARKRKRTSTPEPTAPLHRIPCRQKLGRLVMALGALVTVMGGAMSTIMMNRVSVPPELEASLDDAHTALLSMAESGMLGTGQRLFTERLYATRPSRNPVGWYTTDFKVMYATDWGAFKERIRVIPPTFDFIVDIARVLEKDTRRHNTVPIEKRVAMWLYQLANGVPSTTIEDLFKQGKSTINTNMRDMSALFSSAAVQKRFIKLPCTAAELASSRAGLLWLPSPWR